MATRRSLRCNVSRQRPDALKPKRLLGLGEKYSVFQGNDIATNITSIAFTGLTEANKIEQYVSESERVWLFYPLA